MKRTRRESLPLSGSRLTATVSVAMVLILLGIVALAGVGARNASEDLRSRIGFTVIMSPESTADQIGSVKRLLESSRYARAVHYSDADAVLARWNVSMDEDGGGDDVLSGFNPFLPEFEVAVKSDFSSEASLNKIAREISGVAGVHDVKLQGDLAKSINATVRSLSLVLIIVAGVLTLISFVLVNNTVRLSIYSRRFLIHTMMLVGATRGFIRRPFVVSGILIGVVAGLVSVLILGGGLYYAGERMAMMKSAVSVGQAAGVLGGVFCVGIVLCVISSFISTNRYLQLDYDELFK